METVNETIERLAKLSAIEYEWCRREEAGRLGLRVGVLDKEVKAAQKRADQRSQLRFWQILSVVVLVALVAMCSIGNTMR